MICLKKEHLIRFGLISTISIGMLLTNIAPTFALTDENYEEAFSESNSTYFDTTSEPFITETAPIAEATPIVESNSTTEEVPVYESNSTTEEIPVDESGSATDEIPVDESNSATEEIPVDSADSATEETPTNESDSATEEISVDESGSATDDDPADATDSATEETSADATNSAIEETPSDESNSITEETPADESDSAAEEIPSDETAPTEEIQPTEESNSTEAEKDTNSDESFTDTEEHFNENSSEPTLSDGDSSNNSSETPQPDTDTTPTKPDINLSCDETKTGTSKTTSITDNNTQAIYIQPAYVPSEIFIDIEDRIKYNTRLPIDNIPSFITQEMIVGALKCQDDMNYPASVTIAQIILESGFGQYGPGGDEQQGLSYLAYEYCNLFGIKGVGTAGSVDMRTGEQTSSGEYYTINAGFRVYNTYTECIQDRTELLKNVYSDLIDKVTDANTFATRIGSRWATSLQYSQNLITIMKRYDLYRLDKMTLKDFNSMTGKFTNPCPGAYVTSEFGYRTFDNSFHKGIDLGTNGSKIPTYAADAGTVIIAGYNTSAGNWIVIDHGNGLVTKYMHHSHIFVSAGDKVEKGQQIGLTGNTGNSFGIHLHFQVEENGVAVDPSTYLDFDLK